MTFSDECGLFCANNSAVHLAFFIYLSLPGFILSVLYAVSLIAAKDINWKMRAILLNGLAPEFFNFVAYVMDDIGYVPLVLMSTMLLAE